MPQRDAPWVALVPGALLFGLGIEVIQVVAAYVIAPWSLSKQGTYGALGLAAALLVGLFAISRLMVGAAELNATLWERQSKKEAP
jgi:membrane protein